MDKRICLLSTEVEGCDFLVELALDVRWSWNHTADEIWSQLDPVLWDLTRNPWIILQTVSKEKIENLLSDPVYSEKIKKIVKDKRETEARPSWFSRTHPDSPLKCIVYFCMEYMLTEALPIYSGGLGNVAGDQLKGADDLGVPVIAIGLLYPRGYFRQVITKEGIQVAMYPYNDSKQLPIMPLRDANGEWLRVQFDLPSGETIWLRVWLVQVGSVTLYLLDINDPANLPQYRDITNELYGGDLSQRFLQEVVLGIGGYRLLDVLGIEPQVCHYNEGHAAFAILERARSFMRKTQQPFKVALAVTRAGNLFTTHTPVAAGFDHYPPELLEKYLRDYAETLLGISFHDFLALGRANPNDSTEKFNMAYLAIRGCNAINGVSELHGRVSRHLFSSIFPRWPVEEVPIGYVTNGVHMPTWSSPEGSDLWQEACETGNLDSMEKDIRCLSDPALWKLRNIHRKTLVSYVRERLAMQFVATGEGPGSIAQARELFRPDILTLGFARRFAAYKRNTLLLKDPERFLRILSNPERPMQLVIAGKAHPADKIGQAMIEQWIHFIRGSSIAREHIIFLADHDIAMTEQYVQGVDVWLNMPRRPWEASGTSGMKVLVNGGLNLSELDGWWAEAYTPEVGWALGDGQEHTNTEELDQQEADELYNLLEHDVSKDFYTRNAQGIPTEWVNRMRESMATLTPQYAVVRTVREYTEKHYIPAAASFLERAANSGAKGVAIVKWENMLDEKWPGVHFGEVNIEINEQEYIFDATICLNELDPNMMRVELYANGINGAEPERINMERVKTVHDLEGCYVYRAHVPAVRPAETYTARVFPHMLGIKTPIENQRILWQK